MANKNVAVKRGKERPAKTGLPGTGSSVLEPLGELRQRMDRMFDDFMDSWHMPSWRHDPWSLATFEMPPLLGKLRGEMVDVRFNLSEDGDKLQISAELPGLDEKDVDLTVADGVVIIKGEKKEEHEEKDKDHYLSERRYGSFMRSFRVPESVDENKIKATFDKGVLKIALPKRPEARKKPKKIAISKT